MELTPRPLQRQWMMLWVQISPRRWFLPLLRGPSWGSFLVLFFTRWLLVALWTMPVFAVGFCLAFLALPFVLLVTAFLALWNMVQRVAWRAPLERGSDWAWSWTRVAFAPEEWLEKQL